MVSSDIKLVNVVGGKTARACDNCIRRRARWYCAADDAFLCQSCDGSVHSPNPLARRHQRVRLKVASSPAPWHQGFTKKPRTPRGGKYASRQKQKSEESSMSSFNPLHLVPEIGSDEVTCGDEQLLYQVPVFDPFAAELCLSGNSNEVLVMPVKQTEVTTPAEADHHQYRGSKVMVDLNSLNGLILPSDVELAEFAADVESLLGKGLDEGMEGLELLDCREMDYSGERVKVEQQDDDDDHDDQMQSGSEREPPFQLSFDYDSPLWEEKVAHDMLNEADDDHHHIHTNIQRKYDDQNNKRFILQVDYEAIIAAWDEEQRSPWTTGHRPELDRDDDSWPECMDGIIMNHHQQYPYGDIGMMTGNPAMLDGGREARVSRYREKRRTRLFSKKIRYEVRKLNAEKRPRMKGRFVKRASSSSGLISFA